MRQDAEHWAKPAYDHVEPRTIHFILTLTIGVSSLRQGAQQAFDPWEDAPASLMGALDYLLFGGVNAV